jgi:hypothetical protein
MASRLLVLPALAIVMRNRDLNVDQLLNSKLQEDQKAIDDNQAA